MFCKNRKCQAEIPDDSLFCQYCGHRQTPKPRKATRRPNGTGSVYYMGPGRSRPWRIVKDGVTIGYETTKALALKHLERLPDKEITARFNMTFTEVYNEWKSEHFRTLTPKGQEGYTTAYKNSQPLYDLKFRHIRTKDFQSVVDAASPSVGAKIKQLAGQLYKWAMREDIVTTNYAPFIQLREAETKEKEIFSDQEIELLVKDNSEAAQIVLMMIYTGVRIGELFGATLSNYHTTYFIGGSKTKAGKNRIIPIPAVAQDYFLHFAATATDRLLDGYTGNTNVNNFRKRDFADLMDRLNISGKTPHSARHTFTTNAVKKGVSPELLKKILGHASYVTTIDNYAHSDVSDLCDAANHIW